MTARGLHESDRPEVPSRHFSASATYLAQLPFKQADKTEHRARNTKPRSCNIGEVGRNERAVGLAIGGTERTAPQIG